MSACFLFNPITNDKVKALRKANSVSEKISVFTSLYNLKYPQPLSYIICEYDINNYDVMQHLSNEKISTFVGIAHHVLTRVVDQHNSFINPIDLFQKILIKHSTPKPPDSIAIFTREEFAYLTNHIKNRIDRYLPLLEFLFRPSMELCLRSHTLTSTFPLFECSTMIGAKEIDPLKEPLFEFCFPPKPVEVKEPESSKQPEHNEANPTNESSPAAEIYGPAFDSSRSECKILQGVLDNLKQDIQTKIKTFDDSIIAKMPAKAKK